MSDSNHAESGAIHEPEPPNETSNLASSSKNDVSPTTERPDGTSSTPTDRIEPSEDAHAAISIEPVTSEQAQAMARSGSSSSISSLKEGDAPEAAPYGTRSRNRASASRPNYADDIDGDSDAMSDRNDYYPTGVRSVSTDLAGGVRGLSESRWSLEADSQKPSGRPTGTNSSAPDDYSQSGSPSAAGSATEKKKRKYERAHGPQAKSGLGADAAGIPGTSQFLARPSGTPEARPAKRRKAATSNAEPSQRSARKSSPAPIARPIKLNDRRNCLVTFEKCKNMPEDGKLVADDGDVYSVDDHIYTVCEPPGDPYYLSRIMQFRRLDEKDPNSPIKFLLVNWYYRPKDIGKYSIDPRLLFASMHSDEIPITSLRGKCEIKHRTEIRDMEKYKRGRDTFYFTQLYDRYIHRPYEMIQSSAVINVPDNVKKALNDRWKFIVLEQSAVKELTRDAKTCKKCSKYCAPNDSVDCGICRNTYHMSCLEPPLPKKPSRGFAWSCVPCSKAHEKKLEQRHTAIIPEHSQDADQEPQEDAEGEEDEQGRFIPLPSPEKPEAVENLPGTQAEMAQANLWPWRYLGIHCAVEDVLQYDDRAIYPRASSRLGPRFQAVTADWPGRPLVLVKRNEIKRKFIKTGSGKKEQKLAKESLAAVEADKAERAKRPKWVQDEPKGYVARGEDHDESDSRCTAVKLSAYPFESSSATSFVAANAAVDSGEKAHEEYMDRVRALASKYGLADPNQPQNISANYLDKALYLYLKHKSDPEAALKELAIKHSPTDLGNPEFTKEELKKFEDGVRKHGSDLRSVKKHVKTKSQGDIVRFYYTWKWTARGKEIWGSYEGRRGAKRRAEASWTQVADEEDDSAFDNDKSEKHKQRYQCKFCSTRSSRQWRRAPQVAPGQYVWADPKAASKEKLVVALCERCANMWRRYALTWEDPEEIVRAMNLPGGRAWKRKGEEDLVRELVYANEAAGIPTGPQAASLAMSLGVPVTLRAVDDSLKKKGSKQPGSEKESTPMSSTGDSKKKVAAAPPPPRPPTPPIVPAQPKMRIFPCAVCSEMDTQNDQLVTCKECRLTVHRRCYAVPEQSKPEKWTCDTCLNDRNQQYSLRYKCMLCPVTDQEPELAEFSKMTHKKKNDRDKEKERLERELAMKMVDEYKKQQLERRRPQWPREALKPTSSNNWVHVTCAVWTPEIKFGDAEKMEGAEGMGEVLATPGRVEPVCKICKAVDGACIACYQCHTPFHVACAQGEGYIFGFDVSPVKGSRKDSINSATLGSETGALTAAVWCKDHAIKGIYHPMTEFNAAAGLNALQLFVLTFKQADLALTGTARKANHLIRSTKAVSQAASQTSGNRRTSVLVNGHPTASKQKTLLNEDVSDYNHNTQTSTNGIRKCKTCSTDTALRWHELLEQRPHMNGMTNGITNGELGHKLHDEVWQCHKCFTEGKQGIESKPYLKEEAGVNPASQPDYFELLPVIPPPAPPLPPPGLADQTGYGYKTSLRHPDSAFLGTNGGIAELERCQRVLWKSSVTVRNNVTATKCFYHTFYGQEFGDLDRRPGDLWQEFIDTAIKECRFDPQTSIIKTGGGDAIVNNPETLMNALVDLCKTGPVHTYWDVQRVVAPHAPPPVAPPHIAHQHPAPLPPRLPERQQSFGPPPTPNHTYPPPMYGSMPNTGYPPPSQRLPAIQGHQPPPPPSLPRQSPNVGFVPPPTYGPPPPPPPHGHPPPPHIQPPSQHLPPMQENYSPTVTSRPTPYYTQPRVQHPQHSPHPAAPHHERHQSIPSAFAGGAGSASPPAVAAPRPSTPRDPPPPGAGASSSPNLKNLVH